MSEDLMRQIEQIKTDIIASGSPERAEKAWQDWKAAGSQRAPEMTQEEALDMAYHALWPNGLPE